MSNLLFSPNELGGNVLKETSHCLFSVEHCPHFFITGNVVLDFLLERLVDLFVFQDAHKALVNFGIQNLVFASQIALLFAESFSFQYSLIQIAFGGSQSVIQIFQFLGELLVSR